MPISSERYRAVVEQPTSYGQIDSAQLRAALNRPELRGILADETNVDANAAIDHLVDQANAYGLELADVQQVLPEMIQQLQIEANAVARHGHEAQRRKTKFLQIPTQIGLRWQEMLETFGAGKIAQRAKAHRAERLGKVDYITSLTDAALERASLRKRFHQYLTIGGADLQAAVQDYTRGRQDKVNIKDRDVNISSGQSEQFIHDQRVLGAVEKIADQLVIPDPFVIGHEPDGTPIEIPVTPETEAIIHKHIRFILRDELLQLVQMSTMEVMTTKQYEVESRKLSVTASKILGSGSLWGFLTRTGGKLAIGGSLAAASWAAVPVGGAVLAAFGIGAVAGAASQFAQYYGARRQQRKMDLAIGAEHRTVLVKPQHYYVYDKDGDPVPRPETPPKAVEVTKSAENINQALHVSARALAQEMAVYQQRPNEALGEKVVQSIYVVYGTIVDTEFRLLQTRRGRERQDYINFGLENRLASQSELLKNIRNANEIVHAAIELFARDVPADLPEDWMGEPRTEMQYQDPERMRFITIRERLNKIAQDAQYEIGQVAENLESALKQGEGQRRLVGAVLGGTFAGFTSMAMGYVEELFASRSIDVGRSPTFEYTSPHHFTHDGQAFTAQPTDAGDLVITDAAGRSQTLDLPDTVKVREVVFDERDLRLYDATTGKPVGRMELDLVAPAAAELKAPALDVTLSPERPPQLITVGDKQFGLVMDKDANITVHPTNPADHTLDLSHPLTRTPLNIFADDVRQKIASLAANPAAANDFANKAAQLHVETRADGMVTIQSVYDKSVVAEFKIDPGSTSLTPAPLPESAPTGTTSGTSTLLRVERLFADPANPVAKLLKTMGVEQTDLKVNPDGIVQINDESIKGDYLGKTGGWRQQRLGLMLEAYQQGRIAPGESAEIVLARLERATRHVLSESAKYPSHEAALKEAFGRDVAFIQKAEVPYVQGSIKGFDGVSKQWTELVDGLRKLPAEPVTPSGAGAAGHAAAEALSSHPPAEVAAPATTVTAPRLEDSLVRNPVALPDIYQPEGDPKLTTDFLEDTSDDEELFHVIRRSLALGAAEMYLNIPLKQSHLTGSRSGYSMIKERGTTVDSLMYDQSPDEEASLSRLRRPARNLPQLERSTSSQRMLEQNLRGVNAEVLGAWQREFSSASEALVYLTNRLRTEGLLNDQNIAALSTYLDVVPAYGRERLINAGIIYAGGHMNPERIRQIVERFRDQPDQNPFIEPGIIDEEVLTTRIPQRRLVPDGRGGLRSPHLRPAARRGEASVTEADPMVGQAREQLERSLRERFEAIGAGYVIEGLLHEDHFRDHIDVINAFTDAFTAEDIFDEEHLRLLVHYLLVVPGEDANMLRQAGLLGEDNQPNLATIARVAESISSSPDRNPFLGPCFLNSRFNPESDSRPSARSTLNTIFSQGERSTRTPPTLDVDDLFDLSRYDEAEASASATRTEKNAELESLRRELHDEPSAVFIDIIQRDVRNLNPQAADAWLRDFPDRISSNTILYFLRRMMRAGMYDATHINLLASYLEAIPGIGIEKLKNAGILFEDSRHLIDRSAIPIARFKQEPNKNPFID